MRLINPSSSVMRNKRGLGLPICGFGVSVPISINPNPKLANSLNHRASLSNPAAKPTGFLKVNPNSFRSKRLSLVV